MHRHKPEDNNPILFQSSHIYEQIEALFTIPRPKPKVKLEREDIEGLFYSDEGRVSPVICM